MGGFLDSFIQVRKEATWGTRPSSNYKKIPILSLGLTPELQVFRSQMSIGAAGSPTLFNGPILDKGPFTSELTYNGIDWLLYGVMGTLGTTGDGTTGSYYKTIVPATTIPSFTVEGSYGDTPAGKVYSHLGVQVNALEIAFDAANGIGQVSADLIAKKENGTAGGDTATATGLTTVVAEPVQLAAEATIWNPGAGADTAFCVRSGRIRIERGLTQSRICLGSVDPKQPKPSKTMVVTAELMVEFDADTIYEAFKARGAQTSFRLKWVGAATGIGADNYMFDARINLARITKAFPLIEQGDQLVAPVALEGYGNAGVGMTKQPCAFQTVNNESGAYLA